MIISGERTEAQAQAVCPLTCRLCTRRCHPTHWSTPGHSVSVVVGLHFEHLVVLIFIIVFIIVLNGHEAAVTTMTAHKGEGVVVLVDLGGSYRLPQPVASIPKDRENVNSQLLILMIL